MKKFFVVFFLALAPLSMHGSSTLESVIEFWSSQQLYQTALLAKQDGKYKYSTRLFKELQRRYPKSPFYAESVFRIAEMEFEKNELAAANALLTQYLALDSNVSHLEEAIRMKFSIATQYEKGYRDHLMGLKKMPKVFTDKELALEIYEEIIISMPRHELAAESLFRKGVMLLADKDFKESVESFQTLIRRFPTNPLAPESYLEVGRVYMQQMKQEFPDPDLYDLALINFEQFKKHFPTEPRVQVLEKQLLSLQESLAKQLFEIGAFYQRTKKYNAASLYYSIIVHRYGLTKYAHKSKIELRKMNRSLVTNYKQDESIVVDAQKD